MNVLHLFLTGAGTMGFVVAAVFFFRFWHETRDRLFVLFAIAFGMGVVSGVVLSYEFGTN